MFFIVGQRNRKSADIKWGKGKSMCDKVPKGARAS